MKINYILPVLLTAVLSTGCAETFLDLKPLDKQTEAVYFNKPSDFEYAANNLHTNIYAWGGNETYAILFDYGTDLVVAEQPTVSGTNAAGTGDSYWDKVYNWLRTTNIVIEKGRSYPNPDEIAGPIGQAYFFRAWHHFFLLKRFGGVPVADHVTDVAASDATVWGPRNSRYEVVKLILDDLDTAIKKLDGTTVATTGNDGHVTLEAAKAFKARVCLFEATWEKYVGDKTDGDGINTGAGSAKPADYPSINDMLKMAKDLSGEIIDSHTFELWKGVETVNNGIARPEMYEHTSYFYLFNLEGGDSNPSGLTKESNKEAIFRTVYDAVNKKSNTNLTHTVPATMTRKLADMYLCRDGLPIHVSPLFSNDAFVTMNKELENRDYRMLACVRPDMDYSWGYGAYKTGADYKVDITTLAAAQYQIVPNLRNAGSGMKGRKFCTELQSVTAAGNEAMDYMHIRYAEVLLIYAEAACELGNGTISNDDLDKSINVVRSRGGVAPLNAALIAQAKALGCDLTFIGEIRRERATELYGEGHRLSDLCRWGIAEAELGGQNRCGVYISYGNTPTFLQTLVNPSDNKPVYVESTYSGLINQSEITYSYEGIPSTKPGAVIIELAANRKFSIKNYLQPIPTAQIERNHNLKQNPQW
ncbi:MAG: RagB/SusD family nutrient uptake outer membrane protein [Muribaculaceae bacterium]|nr:RagB/SusD family nutrient uptake outer membrane protein [Muribaculaceae bacterium]